MVKGSKQWLESHPATANDKEVKRLDYLAIHHHQLKTLRNAVGGNFSAAAAKLATRNVEPNAIGKLEIRFDALRSGAGRLRRSSPFTNLVPRRSTSPGQCMP